MVLKKTGAKMLRHGIRTYLAKENSSLVTLNLSFRKVVVFKQNYNNDAVKAGKSNKLLFM